MQRWRLQALRPARRRHRSRTSVSQQTRTHASRVVHQLSSLNERRLVTPARRQQPPRLQGASIARLMGPRRLPADPPPSPTATRSFMRPPARLCAALRAKTAPPMALSRLCSPIVVPSDFITQCFKVHWFCTRERDGLARVREQRCLDKQHKTKTERSNEAQCEITHSQAPQSTSRHINAKKPTYCNAKQHHDTQRQRTPKHRNAKQREELQSKATPCNRK